MYFWRGQLILPLTQFFLIIDELRAEVTNFWTSYNAIEMELHDLHALCLQTLFIRVDSENNIHNTSILPNQPWLDKVITVVIGTIYRYVL